MRQFVYLFTFLLAFAANAQERSPFQVTYPTVPLSFLPGQQKSIQVEIKIPPNYFIYHDKTKLNFVELDELQLKGVQYPASKKREDPFLKKTMDVYEGNVVIEASLEAPPDARPGQKMVEALVKLQGCSDILCYPEETHLVSFRVDVGLAEGALSKADEPSQTSLSELIHAQDFSKVVALGWWMVLGIVFIGGFLTSLTPCVLPVIPVTLMIIGVRADAHFLRNFFLSFSLVLGLALSYALFGVLAVVFGKSLGFVFQQKWFVIFLAVGFFVLSLSMFGLFEIHLPQKLAQRLNQITGHGFWGAFASGIAAGLLAAPCAGPVIGALLLFVAGTQNYFQGFGLLFVYALGMGVLFVVLGTAYGFVKSRFKNYAFTVWIKKLLAVFLLLGSLFYFNSVIPVKNGFETFFTKPSPVGWIQSEREGLKIARQENKIMLIDFYADWCAPCKELELGFFRKPEVVALLKQMVAVRIDATFMDDPEIKKVVEKYHVIGWPTVVFVGPDGKILKDLTVVSYNPKLLLENMKRAIEK